MKTTSLMLRIGLIAPLVFIFSSSGSFSPSAPALADGFDNFLTNPGLEVFQTAYDYYDGHPLQVAQNWTAFTKSGATPKYMTTHEWAAMSGGKAEKLEGNNAQMYWETDAFAAGIYQQVSVTPGTDYTAQASILTIWETSATQTDDKMLKQVGIDPNGGTDPNSPDIVWGQTRGEDVQWESKIRTSAKAISSTITLFVLVTSEASSNPSLRNQVFVDAVVLTKAPSASATSPTLSTDLSFTVEWSGTPAYSGNSLEYDVEYKVDDGSWTFWKGKTESTSVTFGPTSPITVEHAQTYHFRARAWEHYGYYSSIRVKLPGVFADGNGDTSTLVSGSQKATSAETTVYGQTVTYTIVIRDLAAPPTTTVYLTDVVPAGLTYVLDSFSATSGTVTDTTAPTLRWSGTLTPTPAVTATYVTTVNATTAQVISNSAVIAAPGYQTLTRTATVSVGNCISLTGVTLTGATIGIAGQPNTFNAVVSPSDATTPIAYTWSPNPGSGQGTNQATYTWTITGGQTISVSLSNCNGTPVTATHTITVATPVTATVEPAKGGTLTDTQNLTTTVEWPAGAVTDTITLIYTPTASTHFNLQFAGHAFELEAYTGGNLQSDFVFSKPITVTIHYSDGDVAGLDEDSLMLYYWNGSSWEDAATTCDPALTYHRHPDENWLAVSICHLSEFALVGAWKYRIYLPLVLKNFL